MAGAVSSPSANAAGTPEKRHAEPAATSASRREVKAICGVCVRCPEGSESASVSAAEATSIVLATRLHDVDKKRLLSSRTATWPYRVLATKLPRATPPTAYSKQ
eukprot:1296311-Prymnesium_polylepis.1